MDERILQSSSFKIKNPSGIFDFIFIGFFTGLILNSFLRHIRRNDVDWISFYMEVGLLSFCIISLGIIVIRSLKKPWDLFIHSEYVSIRGRTLESNQIKSLMVMKNIRRKNYILGIKPNNKVIVPVHWCFQFHVDEDKGMEELARWAEDNHIPVIHKNKFVRRF
ncbi:hypothetical protein [Paenibacillus glacialis]|uniref:Uncharacterized protein n=1 Tax=Paenibacillus glacialis TaxID=494026 RepID=A0A168KSX0_9BACL|nr:hypothetical protein [Paenibacillus glacialis]OAB42421.1 hypothetical protein PGLA_12165 [Paenibacillus glacialis]